MNNTNKCTIERGGVFFLSRSFIVAKNGCDPSRVHFGGNQYFFLTLVTCQPLSFTENVFILIK